MFKRSDGVFEKLKRFLVLPLLFVFLTACGEIDTLEEVLPETEEPAVEEFSIEEGEFYSDPQDVVDYLDLFGELPSNYLTKNEARDLGWDAKEGNLWEVAPDMSIGGDYFGNFEELLPEADGRDYFEADVNYEGGHRGAERLVFSDDGLYFYTDDHYDSFTELKPGGE